jgi:acyl carrier protein
MACKIVYKGKTYSEPDFVEYFKNNTSEFAQHFLEVSDIQEVKTWYGNNKRQRGRTWEEQKEVRNEKFESLAQYPRSDRADDKLAYLSRNFREEFFYDPVSKALLRDRIDVDNNLNDRMEDPRILSSKFFPVGTPLSFEIDDDPNTVMYAGRDNREETTWGLFRASLDPSDYHLYIPISVKDETGRRIAYIHNVNWVDESNLQNEELSIDDLYRLLANLRLILYNNKKTKATISSREPGAVSMVAPYTGNRYPKIPLAEGAPNAEIAVVAVYESARETGVSYIDDAITELEGQSNINFFEGEVVAYMPGEYPVVTYTEPRTLNAVEVETLTRAIYNHIVAKDEFGDQVREVMGIDLETPAGFKEYLRHFIHVTPVRDEFQGYKGKEYQSDLHYQIRHDQYSEGNYFIGLHAGSNSINFVEGGLDGHAFNASKNIKKKETIDRLMPYIKDFISKMKVNTARELLNKTYNIVLSKGDIVKTESRNYLQYTKEALSSRILGFNVGTEEDPEWVYRLNPKIKFELDDRDIVEIVETDNSKLGTPIEEKPIDPRNILSEEDRKAIEKIKRRGNRKSDARPITADQLAELEQMSIYNRLLPGINPIDLGSIIDSVSSMLIKRAIDFDKKTINDKALNKFFDELRVTFTAKQSYYVKKVTALEQTIKSSEGVEAAGLRDIIESFQIMIDSFDAILNNYDQFIKFVFHDLAGVTGIDLKDFSNYADLKKAKVEDIQKALSEGLKEVREEIDPVVDPESPDTFDRDDEDPADPLSPEFEITESPERGGEFDVIARLKKSAKQSISVKLKLFLRGLLKHEFVSLPEGGFKGVPIIDDIYGLPQSLNPDEVIDFLIPELTNRFPTYEEMFERMEELAVDNLWLNVVTQALKKADDDIHRDFFRVFDKVVIKMKYLMTRQDGSTFKVDTLEDNISETTRLIVRNWESKFKGTSELVTSSDGEFYINISNNPKEPDIADKWIKWAEEARLGKRIPPPEEFKEFLELFGIELHADILNTIVTGQKIKGSKYATGFRYYQPSKGNFTTITYSDQFRSQSVGIVPNLISKLRSLTTYQGEASKDNKVQKEIATLYNTGIIQALAREQAKRSPNLRSGSFFSGSNAIASHVDPYYIAKRNYDIKKRGFDKETLLFNHNNYWVDEFTFNPNLLKEHDISFMSLSPTREFDKVNFNKDYKKHDELNKEVIKLGLFTSGIRRKIHSPNESESGPERFEGSEMAIFFYPTLGSNSRPFLLTGPKYQFIIPNVNKVVDNDITQNLVTDEMIEMVYRYVFMSEAERMAFSTTSPTDSFEKGKHIFYAIPALNTAVPELFDEEHKLIVDDKATIISSDKAEKVKEVITSFLADQISAKLNNWKRLGIGFKNSEGVLYDYLDSKYLANIKQNLKTVKEESDQAKVKAGWAPDPNLVLKNAAADFVVNNVLALHSMFGLYIGDPATFYKQSEVNRGLSLSDENYDFNKDIDATRQGIFKRLGTEIGPAAQQYAEKTPLIEEPLSVIVVEDIFEEIKEEIINYYKKIGMTDEEIASYRNINTTDGIIFNHPLEHLNSMWRFGKITHTQHKAALKYYNSTGNLPKDIAITTLKTRYLDQHVNDQHQVRIHLKGAEFYLSPEMIEGNKVLEKIYHLMGGKNMKIHKVAFTSTVKTGKGPSFKMFNKDGTITKRNSPEGNVLRLTRSGLQLQTNTPDRSQEETAKLATQAIKQIFLDVEDKFKNTITKFHKHYNNIVEKNKREFFETIGYDEKTKTFDIRKFAKKLNEHLKGYTKDLNTFSAIEVVDTPAAKIRRVEINETLKDPSLDLHDRTMLEWELENLPQELKSPLFAAPSRNMIEPYVMSMVSSIIDDIQFPGSTYTLTTKAYLGENVKGITYTSGYDPEKGLQHYRYTEDGKEVLRSQVIISWPFPSLDMEDYIGEDGKIDTKSLPPRLLKLVATRIPVAKQASIHALEIVGFMPSNYKGVVVTHPQLIAQTGWDMDDDKLFFYYPEYDIVDENGIVYGTRDEEGKVLTKDSQFKSIVIKPNSDVNGMLKSMEEVLLSPDPDVRKILHTPVSTEPLKKSYEILYEKATEVGDISYLSEAYYTSSYENQSNVGDMIGISANHLNLHAVIRQTFVTPLVNTKSKHLERIVIAGQTSYRQLGRQFDAKGNSITNNITAVLQASVDHANLGWLSYMNISPHTTSSLTQTIEEGYTPEVAVGIITQEIVKEFGRVTDTLRRESESGFGRINVLERLIKIFPNKQVSDILANKKWRTNEKLIKILDLYDFRNPDTALGAIREDELLRGGRILKDDKGEPILDKNKNLQYIPFAADDPIHWQVLVAFIEFTDTGKRISGYQTRVNVDSKGYGKLLYMAENKMTAPLDLATETSIIDFRDILGEFIVVKQKDLKRGEPHLPKDLPNKKDFHFMGSKTRDGDLLHIYLRPTTVYGISVVHGKEALENTILNPANGLYPYNSNSFKTIWRVISDTANLSSRSSFEVGKINQYAFSEALAYFNSANATNLYNDIPAKRRRELLINKRGKHTVAHLLDLAKRDPYLKDNPFLDKLTAIHEADGQKSSIEYSGIQRDELSRNAVYTGFYDLLSLENKLIPGTEVTTTEFVEMLVEAAFLNGGIQHARNYIKVIPADYLRVKGYYDFLYDLDFRDPAIFGYSNTGKYWNIEGFVQQFFRHYPEFIRPHKRGKNEVRFKEGEVVNVRTAGTFKVPKEFAPKREGDQTAPTLLHFIDKNGESQLFNYNGTDGVYEKLELLRDYPDSQYDANIDDGYNRPAQNALRGVRHYTGGRLEVFDPEKGFVVAPDILHAAYTKDRTVPEIIDNILTISTNEDNKRIAEFLKEVYSTNLVKVNFKVMPEVFKDGVKVKGKHGRDVITGGSYVQVAPSAHDDHSDYESTLIHELLHPVISTLVVNYDKGGVIKNPDIKENIAVIKSAFLILRERVKAQFGTLNIEQLEKDLPVGFKSVANATLNLSEFVAEALSSDSVREYLNVHVWKGDTNLLKRFYKAIVTILQKAGFKWGERLGDKIEAILLNQRNVVLADKINEYKRLKKEIAEEGNIQTLAFPSMFEARDRVDAYFLTYGPGITNVDRENVPQIEGMWVIEVDRSKILDRLLARLPEVFNEDDFSETIERVHKASDLNIKSIYSIDKITSKELEYTIKKESPLDILAEEKKLLAKYEPGRVVHLSENEIGLLKQGYVFIPVDFDFEEDAKPLSYSAALNQKGKKYTFLDVNVAEKNRNRLKSLYGDNRVSTIQRVKGKFVVELYSLDQASDFQFSEKYPVRASRKAEFEANKKSATRQQIIADHITDRIDQLNNILGKLERDEKENPSTENIRKINQLIDQIEELEGNRKDFYKEIVKTQVIDEFIARRLEVLEGLINNPDDLILDEMDKISQELNWIQAIGDQTITSDHFLFGDDWVKLPTLRTRMTGYGKTAGDLALTFHQTIIDTLVNEMNRRRLEGQDHITKDDIIRMIEDVDPLTANTTTIFGASSHALVELIGKLVNEHSVKQAISAKDNYDKVDELIKNVLQVAPNKNKPFEVFFEKDKNGEATNWLTHFFSYEYRKQLNDLLKSVKDSSGSKRKKKLIDWQKENTNFIDVRMLFPTTVGDTYHYEGKGFTDAERAKYIKDLKEEYGDYIYSKLVEDAQLKVKRFASEYELEKHKLAEDTSLNQAEKKKSLLIFEMANSPYVIAEEIIDGETYEGYRGYGYVSQPPKRYKEIDGKRVDTGWVNEKFFEIANNPAYLEFYEYAYDKLGEINTIDPDALGSILGHRAINFMKKRFAESMMGSGNVARAALAYGKESIIESLTDRDEPFSFNKRVDKDGNTIYRANNHVVNDQREVTKLANRLKVDFIADMNKVDTEAKLVEVLDSWNIPSAKIVAKYNAKNSYNKFNPQVASKVARLIENDKEHPEVYRAIRERASKEYFAEASHDLGTILKYYTTLSNTYRSAYGIESIVNMTVQVFNQSRIGTRDSYDNLIEIDGLKGADTNLKDMIDYQLRVTMGWERYHKGKVSKEKAYTDAEKKKLEDYNKRLEDPLLDNDIKDLIRREISELGRPVYKAKLIDGLLKYTALLGLGWRLVAGSANLLLGQASNLIEAGYGRFFTDEALRDSMRESRWSILKNMTFNKYEHPEAKKMRNIADRYGLVSDMTTEFYKSSALSPMASWLRFLAPAQITKRVEYLNQTGIIRAYLKSHKVSEYFPDYKGDENLYQALDENGKWNDEKFGRLTVEKLNSVIYEPIEQIKEIMMGPYNFNRTVLGKRRILGRVIGLFHTWIPETIRARFQTERYDPFARVTRKGRYNTMWDVIGNNLKYVDNSPHEFLDNVSFIFQHIFKQAAYNKRFTAHDAANIRGFMREMAVIVSLLTAKLVLEAIGDLDDDKKGNDSKSFALYYLLNASNRLIADLAIVPIFLTSPNSQKGLIPSISLGSNLIKFFTSSFQVLSGDEDEMEQFKNSFLSFVPAATEIGKVDRFLSEEQKVLRR